MIDLYYCGTPNGLKMKVFFEETGLPHRVIPVDLGKGDQFKPEFLAISPNNKIPAMVDHDPVDGGKPIALFESGAMLLYLADKIGRFLPREFRGRNEVIKWLFWQVGGLGPWPDRSAISMSMRRRRSPMRSSAIPTRRIVSTLC